MTLEQLTVVIDAKTSGLKKELGTVKTQLNSLEKTTNTATKSIGSSFSKLSKYISAAAIVGALTKIGKSALEAASDLAEVQNVVDVAFGSAAEEINQFAKTAVTQFGISEYQAKKCSSTFMAMANGMGIAADSGKLMSVQLTGLAADMASFYNVSQDVAETALKSVFTGETETLKKFGVVMTEANLEAYAMSQGITKSYREMSQAEKVALRYNFVLQSTANAQNDYARTSTSWANQLRLLTNNWNNLMVKLGNSIQQVLLPLLQWLNKIIGAVNSLIKVSTNSESGLEASTGEAADNLETATDNAKELKKQISGFDELNVLDKNSSESSTSTDSEPMTLSSYFDISQVSSDQEKLATKILEVWQKVQEKIDSIFSKGWVKVLLAGLLGTVSAFLLGTGASKISSVIGALAKKINIRQISTPLLNLGNSIKKFFTGYTTSYEAKAGLSPFQLIMNDQKGLANAASKTGTSLKVLTKHADAMKAAFIKVGIAAAVIALVIAALVTLYNTNDEFKAKVDEAWENLKNVITNVYENVIVPVFEGIKTLWETLVKPVLEMIWKLILYIVEVVASAVLDLWNGALAPALVSISEMLGTVIKALMPIVEAIIGFLMPAIQSVIDIVAVVLKALEPVVNFIVQHLIVGINGVIGVLKGVITFLTGVFTGNWEMAWQGIKDIFTSIWDTMKNAWSNIANFLKPIVDKIKTLFSNMWDGIKSGAKAAINFIIKVLNGLIDGINILAAPLRLIILAIAKVSGSSASFSDIAIPHIPYLAKGGVITGPTLAMLGEYSGASSNPEIAAPESKLREIFAEGNNDLIDVWISTTKQIITAINNKDMNVSINDDAIGRSVVRANAANKMRTGMALI